MSGTDTSPLLSKSTAHGLEARFSNAQAIAASCEFTTPIGYQTNLMVQGPGGYRLGDYLRFGGPLTLICGVVAVTLLAAFYY